MEKSSSWTWLYILIALFILYQTNPSTADHKAEAKREILASLNKNIASTTNNFWVKEFAGIIGIAAIEENLDQAITRHNYVIFSTTKFSMYGVNETIGFGILGNVFISKEVNTEVDKIFKKGKDAFIKDEKLEENKSNDSTESYDNTKKAENAGEQMQQNSKNITIGQRYNVLASPAFPVDVYSTPENSDNSNQKFKASLSVTVKKQRNGFVYVVYDDSENQDDFIEGWISEEFIEVE